MSDFVFITDLHFGSSGKVRTGNVFEDQLQKLQFVVDYCNEHEAILLLGGDLLDKPVVADYIKVGIIKVLRSLKTKCISIWGNHELLYSNEEYSYKTSYKVLSEAGLIENLSELGSIDLGNVYITCEVPVRTLGKPQIVLYHGLLNTEDGKNTFRFTDIETTDQTYILLGHDHVEYEPLKYKSYITIFRPGSFLRGIRNDTQLRQPKLLHIRVNKDGLKYKLVEIKARDFNEIFKTKEAKVSQSEKHNSYEEIISQIRDSQKSELSFEEAVNQVTKSNPGVGVFIMKALTQATLDKNSKRQNL